jgi:polysaccharide biosynthesis transport protein
MKSHNLQVHTPHLGHAAADNLDQVDLQQYWLVLKRRWKPAAAIFATTLAAAAAYAAAEKPTYTSSGKMLLRTNRIPSF